MKKEIWKYSGSLLILTGVVHNLFGVYFGWNILKDIYQNEIYNSIFNDNTMTKVINGYFFNALEGVRNVNELQRFSLYWFIFIGFFWIGVGSLCNRIIRMQNKPLPITFGYFLLGYSIVACIILPVQGMWILIPQAIIIIAANRKLKSHRTTENKPH